MQWGAPLMRFFKAPQPEQTAEDRAAAVRLMAVANRGKGLTSLNAPQMEPRDSLIGEASDNLQ